MYAQRSNAMNRHTSELRLLIAALLLALLGGCAAYGARNIRMGQTADEVTRALGPPTARYALANGSQRLEYASGAWSRTTYMIDLDPAGRVTAADQVLTELNFNSLPAGMTRDEVLVRIGNPSERFYIGWQQRDVWAYRYPINECQWFMVSIGRDGKVVDMGYGIDWRCDPGGKERT
jgi:outer membrane protein assembly factor BamE (lipoprotein component of BamABCDE complex)